MSSYIALIKSNLLLMGRDRAVLFFSYLFPFSFFFLFAQVFHAGDNPGDMAQVISMVVIIGVLGAGFFGAGMRTVQDRETNVLRRFKVAPISPMPVITASMVSGLVSFLPTVFVFFFFGHVLYHMPLPPKLFSLFFFISLGLICFRAMGMIVASVVNSSQEAQLLVQVLYFPMLLMSGATFPVSIMPTWVQVASQFLPATYLYQGINSMMIGGEGLAGNWFAVVALTIAMCVSLFVGVKLFRWEKDEKIAGKAKLWILVVLAPFFLLGVYQAKTRQNIERAKILARAQSRSRSLLFQNVRIFVGDGNVIPNGAVLIKGGKIVQVFQDPPADTRSLNAEVRDESGRTLMPGMIDMHVHIGSPGGIYKDAKRYTAPNADVERLAAYLYCGITAVRSTGDWLNNSLALRAKMRTGEFLGAELFTYGPLFTTPGGHPTELLDSLPPSVRRMGEKEFVRLPKSPEQADQQVDELKKAGVDGIKAVLDAGDRRWQVFNRLDLNIYRAIISRAAADHLPSATHTGSSADVKDALDAGTNSIEHGSLTDEIPDPLFAAMQSRDIAYDPTLSVTEALLDQATGNPEELERPLVRRVAAPDLLSSTREWLAANKDDAHANMYQHVVAFGNSNLLKAYHAGVSLITGSDAGNMLVIHGPTIQHEMELWVKAGIPPGIALRAATYNAAKALRAEDRIGLIAPQHDATLVLLDGDPVQDITASERIASVFFKGEEVSRRDLLSQDK